MREKPPITENLPQFRATDEEIQAVIKARHLDEGGMSLVEQRMTALTIILIIGVAEAQRDADMAWFQEAIEKLELLEVTAWAKWEGLPTEIITISIATKLCQKVAQAQLDDIKRQLKEIMK